MTTSSFPMPLNYLWIYPIEKHTTKYQNESHNDAKKIEINGLVEGNRSKAFFNEKFVLGVRNCDCCRLEQ